MKIIESKWIFYIHKVKDKVEYFVSAWNDSPIDEILFDWTEFDECSCKKQIHDFCKENEIVNYVIRYRGERV